MKDLKLIKNDIEILSKGDIVCSSNNNGLQKTIFFFFNRFYLIYINPELDLIEKTYLIQEKIFKKESKLANIIKLFIYTNHNYNTREKEQNEKYLQLYQKGLIKMYLDEDGDFSFNISEKGLNKLSELKKIRRDII